MDDQPQMGMGVEVIDPYLRNICEFGNLKNSYFLNLLESEFQLLSKLIPFSDITTMWRSEAT